MSGRIEELVAGWLDGSLTDAEQAELLEALRQDPALAKAFAEEVEIHRGLQFSSSQSHAGDQRSAERVLHYLRASQESTKFVEGVKRRVVSHRSGPSAGPFLIAAALLIAALVGLLLLGSPKSTPPEKTAERPKVQEPIVIPEPVVEIIDPVREIKPAEEERRKQIEAELRAAAEAKSKSAPKTPAPIKPEVPEPKTVVKEPTPEVPTKPEPSRVETLPALARLESIQGEGTVGGEPAKPGAELRDGAMLEAQGLAVVKFTDGTRIELTGEARLHEKLTGKRAAGKGLTLSRGLISADVAKQPAGQSFLFMTPHAEVQVVGTRLSVQTGAETRIDVQEGQVRVSSLKGGQAVTLGAGQGTDLGPVGGLRPFLQGLHATYFDQNNFKGQTMERVEPILDLFLDQAKNELPPVGVDRNFAARWEGRFLAETAGDYVFLLSVDGQVKFALDGQDLVTEPRGVFHAISRHIVRRKLAAGWHDLLMEYADDQGNSRCTFRYVPPGAKVPEGDALQADGAGLPIPARLFSHGRK